MDSKSAKKWIVGVALAVLTATLLSGIVRVEAIQRDLMEELAAVEQMRESLVPQVAEQAQLDWEASLLSKQSEYVDQIAELEASVEELAAQVEERDAQIAALEEQVAAAKTEPSGSSGGSTSSGNTQSVTVYVTNTGAKYHKAGCQYLRLSQNAISLNDAKASGYTACSRCW